MHNRYKSVPISKCEKLELINHNLASVKFYEYRFSKAVSKTTTDLRTYTFAFWRIKDADWVLELMQRVKNKKYGFY